MDKGQHIKELVITCWVCGGPGKQNRLCKDHEAALKSLISLQTKPMSIPRSRTSVAMLWHHGPAKWRLKGESISMQWNLSNGVCMLGRIVWCVQILAQNKKGGRPSKRRKRRGRPSSEDTHNSHRGTETSTPYLFPREAGQACTIYTNSPWPQVHRCTVPYLLGTTWSALTTTMWVSSLSRLHSEVN